MAPSRQAPRRSHADEVDVRRRAWRAVMETQGALTPVLDAELRDEAGLDLQTYDTLLHVFEAGDAGLRMTDLAQKIVLTKAGITSLVDRLEERGLLERTRDPDDRRATRVVLTPLGVETFRGAATVHVQSIQAHFSSRLTDEEARVIADVLERIRQEHLHPADA